MMSATSLGGLLQGCLNRVHLDADSARAAIELVAAESHHDATDALYPLACLLMGRVALTTGDYALAQAPLLRAISAARALGDIDVAVQAAAALDYARAPMGFIDDVAQQAAEIAFARRLAAGADRLVLIAERIRLDLCRGAQDCHARRINRRLGLGLGAAAMLALGWAIQADPMLASVVGDRVTHWAARLACVLPARPALPPDMCVDDRLAPDMRACYPTVPTPAGLVVCDPAQVTHPRTHEAQAAVKAGAPLVIVGDPGEGAALAAAWLGPILPRRTSDAAARRTARLQEATLALIADTPRNDGPLVQLVSAVDTQAWQDEAAVLIYLTK